MTVSDRAKALLKLVQADYLSTCSMPDLFHFMQDLGKSVGSRLSLRVSQAVSSLNGKDCHSEDYDLLREDLLAKQSLLEQYQTKRESINSLVHPFDENDEFTTAEQLEVRLNTTYTEIRKLAKQSEVNLNLQTGIKILNQIPEIANGVSYWLGWLTEKLKELELSVQEKQWMLQSLLPYVYWQINQTKRTTKKKDKRLNEYYSNRVKIAKERFDSDHRTGEISENRKEYLVNWAFRKMATFHRSSSSVEGRNGYLAFVHHANKGIPEKRKKVLTVIHNFDIRRADGKTPAQRLFNREFANLFEFVLEDIPELPRPRKRKMKCL